MMIEAQYLVVGARPVSIVATKVTVEGAFGGIGDVKVTTYFVIVDPLFFNS
ncbi:MAG: hypothetical protein WCL38_01365 [Actinomycetota bacterium]